MSWAAAPMGGAETAFVDTCLAQAESGLSIQVVMRHHPVRVQQLRNAGITVHTLPFGTIWDIYTPWRLKKHIIHYRPHIVQTWMNRASQKVRRCKPSMNIPTYAIIARLGGYYKIKNYKNADYFLAITPDLARHISSSGIDPARIFHINNFAYKEEAQTLVQRANLATPENVPLLLALGRLHPAKAMDILLKAVALVPDAWLWIAGDGPLRAELEALCRTLNITDRVRFLGWRKDRAALLKAASICVFCSRQEPFGSVFIQAWAQKVPVIVSNAIGPRQYVRDGEDALMVPIDNIEATATAIRRLINDKALREKLVHNGWDRYQAEFTKEKIMEAYKKLYQKCRHEIDAPVN